ncbi:hypothetical protein JOF56_001532 [Kibdelosporangium banguiense]|uniref:Uncharacterized protein n=1 Tax=Kibdelosporangium banguiense TaxID=1365924 RepID=A0ABS4T9Q0_9PSEU|nr:hypothetical protein [Kibdelosporangium banguiense]MBP2321147.1 hypothetical protein [Kibdelosporangium banguiense]
MTGGEISEEQGLSVSLLRGQERVISALTWQRSRDRTYSINVDGPDGPVIASGNDLFEALQRIPESLGTVEEQKAYYRDWRQSLKGDTWQCRCRSKCCRCFDGSFCRSLKVLDITRDDAVEISPVG